MTALRSLFLAAALVAVATPAFAHKGAIALALAEAARPAADGPCIEVGRDGVEVAGLPTNVKLAGTLEQRGVRCALSGQLRPAIAHFSEAIRHHPWRSQAYANRGQAYAKLGEAELAVLDYDDALRLEPGRATYRYLRAVSLSEVGRAEEAVHDLEKVLKLRDSKVVGELQRYLATKGYDPGPIDGVYGPATRRALVTCVSRSCFSF